MYKKSYLFIAIFSLALVFGYPLLAQANLSWNNDQIIDLSSPNIDLKVIAESIASSMTVNAGDISVVLDDGDVFTIQTVESNGIQVEPKTGTSINCIVGNIETLTITATQNTTYTITPSSTACIYNASTNGGSSSSSPATSSGGSLNSQPTQPPVPIKNPIPGCGKRTTGFSITTGKSCVGNTGEEEETVTPKRIYNFGNTTLKNRSRGEAVTELQRFLNDTMNLGLVVDGILGPKTIGVIKAWQTKQGLVSDGLVGPKTKARMNASVE